MTLSVTDVIETFQAVCADPYHRAREAAAQGEKIAGYMCTYVPEELLDAAGYFPVRVLGWTDGMQDADALLQTYACSLARGALDAALSGRLDFLDLMVFTHTCDTLQNVADLWRRNVPRMRHLVISMPVCAQGEDAVAFFRGELARARCFLESENGEITDGQLWAAIRLYARHRALMRRLYEIQRNQPRCLSGKEMLATVLASFLMRKRDHQELLEQLLSEADRAWRAAGQAGDNRPRVFVAGSVCQSIDYVSAIEEAGCAVAGDDLCTGARAFLVEPAADGDPLDCLARAYLARKPCPAKYCPDYDVGEDLLEKARRAGADGVIFLLTKFCDPWAFDYPHARVTLERAGIPSLLLEIEQHIAPSANFVTRVAAFAEMLAYARKGKETA
jgi:bzd-type benzoyl-CoA reductase N subunit